MNMTATLSPKRLKVKNARATAAKGSRSLIPTSPNLLAWYDKNQRILPWRARSGETPDPYQVWISEIMLQQTTVRAVIPYFKKFIARWPRVADLAAADREDVLRMWAGLGYYRRAHLMHECALTIMQDHNGLFPPSESSLRELPGFGPYTSAAVAAIAFNQRASVVDGNVERVMARIHAVKTPLPKSKPRLRALAETHLPATRFGDYAQALMDLGAMVCTPKSPACGKCPWRSTCKARRLGIMDQLPRREAIKPRPVRRAIAFVGLNDAQQIWLQKRPEGGLLGGMTEVPSSPWFEHEMPSLAEARCHAPFKGQWKLLSGSVRHVFSHFELELNIAVAYATKSRPGKWVDLHKWKDEALPSVMAKVVRYALNGL